MPPISKSRYLDGLQCDKLLWHRFNAKAAFPPIDAATQAVFDQGHEVGRLAKSLFPGGIEIIGKPWEYERLRSQTEEALKQSRPLFEAAFQFDGAFARVDILRPVEDKKSPPSAKRKARSKRDNLTEDLFSSADSSRLAPGASRSASWDLIEVKSSTSVKEVNISDLALQRYVVEGSGLTVGRCYLMHINGDYIRRGEIDPSQLFDQEDVTDMVAELLPSIAEKLRQMERIIAEKTSPATPIGTQCTDPYECALMDKCWEGIPENSPLTLYRFDKERAFALLHGGVRTIAAIPASEELSDKQEIQVQVERSGKPHSSPEAIAEFMSKLVYPLYYLDFESFNSAIPIFDGTRPYQQIPFQFSLHIQHEEGGELRHISWLAEGDEDPRPEMLKLLQGVLSTEGSIVAYNAPFEKRILNESVEEYPDFETWNATIQERFVDLLEPFRGFAYYNAAQHGSASMKAVLPALVGKSYEGLAISDGEQASREYMRVTFGDATEAERKQVRAALEEYCGQDTLGMVEILGELKKMSNFDLSTPFGRSRSPRAKSRGE